MLILYPIQNTTCIPHRNSKIHRHPGWWSTWVAMSVRMFVFTAFWLCPISSLSKVSLVHFQASIMLPGLCCFSNGVYLILFIVLKMPVILTIHNYVAFACNDQSKFINDMYLHTSIYLSCVY